MRCLPRARENVGPPDRGEEGEESGGVPRLDTEGSLLEEGAAVASEMAAACINEMGEAPGSGGTTEIPALWMSSHSDFAMVDDTLPSVVKSNRETINWCSIVFSLLGQSKSLN